MKQPAALAKHRKLVAKAKRLGLSAVGSTEDLKRRLGAAEKRKKAKKKTAKKKTAKKKTAKKKTAKKKTAKKKTATEQGKPKRKRKPKRTIFDGVGFGGAF